MKKVRARGGVQLANTALHMRRTVGSGIEFREFERAVSNQIIPQQYVLAKLGKTHAGRMAAMQALHPASEQIGQWQWPDRNTAETIVMRNQDVISISAPGSQGSDKTWQMNIYILPTIDATALITRWWSTNADVNNFSGGVKIVGSTDWEVADHNIWYSTPWNQEGSYPGNQLQNARLLARSLTANLVASGLYDQGTIYAGQFVPDIQIMPVGSEGMYEQIKDLIAKQIAAELAKFVKDNGVDPSEVTLESQLVQLEPSTFGSARVDVTDSHEPPIGKTANATVFQDFPNTISEMVQNDKRYYQSDAKHGVYLPLKHAGNRSPELQNASQQYMLHHGSPTGNSWEHHVMFDDSFQLGVVMFRDLLPEAKVNMKMISVVEAVPYGSDLMAKVAKPPPQLDQDAIDAVQEVMARSQNAYPASANSLGTIVDHIASALAGSKIPVLSQIGKLATSI